MYNIFIIFEMKQTTLKRLFPKENNIRHGVITIATCLLLAGTLFPSLFNSAKDQGICLMLGLFIMISVVVFNIIKNEVKK